MPEPDHGELRDPLANLRQVMAELGDEQDRLRQALQALRRDLELHEAATLAALPAEPPTQRSATAAPQAPTPALENHSTETAQVMPNVSLAPTAPASGLLPSGSAQTAVNPPVGPPRLAHRAAELALVEARLRELAGNHPLTRPNRPLESPESAALIPTPPTAAALDPDENSETLHQRQSPIRSADGIRPSSPAQEEAPITLPIWHGTGKRPPSTAVGTDARLGELIHHGTMADTYRRDQIAETRHAAAAQPAFAAGYAVRLLHPAWCRNETMREEFARAVAEASRFRPPHAAWSYQFVAVDDRFGVARDYVLGQPLSEAARGSLSPARTVELLGQALETLEHAEEAGILHRALRPERLLVVDGPTARLAILGYGEPPWLTKLHRCERGRAGRAYLAPEESLAGHPVDIRSDLYSLGMIFRELLASTELPPSSLSAFLDQLTATEVAARPASAAAARRHVDSLRTALADPPSRSRS